MSKLKIASIVLLVSAGLSIALGAVYVSGENQKYQSSKEEVSAAESAYSTASSNYSIAKDYYDSAWSDYNWCFYWCFDEMAVALGAGDILDGAQADLDAASNVLEAAKKDMDDAAKRFNTSATTSGIGAGILSFSAVVFTILWRRSTHKKNIEGSVINPIWFCTECGTSNELGLFCIDCGASKNENSLAVKTASEESGPQAEVPSAALSESSTPVKSVRKRKPKNSEHEASATKQAESE